MFRNFRTFVAPEELARTGQITGFESVAVDGAAA